MGMWLFAKKVMGKSRIFIMLVVHISSYTFTTCPKDDICILFLWTPKYFVFPGSVATAEDPAAIATIQSAATFSDQPIKYVFKTEGTGGQVRNHVIVKYEAVYQSETNW